MLNPKRRPIAAVRTIRRRKKTDRLAIGDSEAVGKRLNYLSNYLAKCENEVPYIQGLLLQIYYAGFANGAVASRKTFTKWKPPRKFSSLRNIEDAIEKFQLEMAVIHTPEMPIGMKN